MMKRRCLTALAVTAAMMLFITVCLVERTLADAPFPAAGEYTLFAVTNEGSTVDSNEIGMTAVVTLNEDGTGNFVINDDSMGIKSWMEADGKITITMEDDSSAEGKLENGILDLDILGDGSMFLILAQKGADISAYSLMTKEEVMNQMASGETIPDDTLLGAFYNSMSTETGIHLSYSAHLDYMNTEQEFESFGKGTCYYCSLTTHVSGADGTSITLFQDGKVYNLSPEDKTATLVTETDMAMIYNNVMLMDQLYSAVWQACMNPDVVEETRERDGAAYKAAVVPENDDREESVFYFNEDGSLAYYLSGTLKSDLGKEMGQTLYTVNAIDTAVDESLFDISGYEIKTLE